MGRPGRAAIVLFALAGLQLLFPPLPPMWKGSVWSWLAGYLGVVAAALEVRRASAGILGRWSALPPHYRMFLGVGTAGVVLVAALVLRASAPTVFERAGREEGLLEPLTLLCYLAGAILLLAAGRGRDDASARPLALLAAVFLLLALEEVDYFGLFGSLVGRVEGQYVGALHDVLGLAVKGALPPAVLAGLAVGLAGLGAVLLRGRWLTPPFVTRTLRSHCGAAGLLGLGLLTLAALVEAETLAPVRRPSPEEAIELAGGICLALFALEVAAREGGAGAPAVEIGREGAGLGRHGGGEPP